MGLENLLEELTKVRNGQSFAEVLTHGRINAIQDALKALASGEHLEDTPDILLDKSYCGVGINLAKKVPKGGGSAAECYSLEIMKTRPSYISAPDPLPTIAAGDFETWVRIGTVNGVLPVNRLDSFVVDADDKYIALKVELSQSSRNLEVTAVTIEIETDPATFQNGAWADQELSQTLPTHVYVYLGHIHRESKAITNYGKGSVDLQVTVSGYFGGNLTTSFTREIQERRLG
jgi:hypothetical protein